MLIEFCDDTDKSPVSEDGEKSELKKYENLGMVCLRIFVFLDALMLSFFIHGSYQRIQYFPGTFKSSLTTNIQMRTHLKFVCN